MTKVKTKLKLKMRLFLNIVIPPFLKLVRRLQDETCASFPLHLTSFLVDRVIQKTNRLPPLPRWERVQGEGEFASFTPTLTLPHQGGGEMG